MAKSEFPERTFEFAFNAEFCMAMGGQLLCAPMIPSLAFEKKWPFDVAFELMLGQKYKLVLLQHKVPQLISVPKKSHGQFVGKVGAPFFRIPLDNLQYNRIVALANSASPLHIKYCAPAFIEYGELNSHFLNGQVRANSVLITVDSCGRVWGKKPHDLIFAKGNPTAWRFSEKPIEAKISTVPKTYENLDGSLANMLPSELLKRLQQPIQRISKKRQDGDNLKASASTQDDHAEKRAFLAVQYILSRVFGVTGIVVPHESVKS